MASFDLVLPIILKWEGGYSNNPNDPGGETNLGITMRTFQVCSHQLLGVDPTSDNLKALTPAQAGIIYRANYWNKIQGDAITLQELANIVCDFYVNAGTNASKLLQTILQSKGAQIYADGSIGPATIHALNSYSQVDVYNAYKQGRIQYYRDLGVRYPMFLKGWLTRAESFPDLPSQPAALATSTS
jgi:lysozyme family protein